MTQSAPNQESFGLGQQKNLAVLIFGALAILADKTFLHTNFSTAGIYYLIVNDILIFSFHVGFTFVAITCIPELRRGLVGMKNRFRWNALTAALVLLAFFLFFYALQKLAAKPHGYFFMGLYQGAATFFFFQHDMAQKYGISSLYNRASRGDSRYFIKERWLFRVLLVLIVSDQVLRAFPFYYNPVPALTPLREKWFSPLALTIADDVLIGFMIICICAILLNSHKIRIDQSREKAYFIGRLFFYAFMPFSFAALIVVQFCHGSEYLMVTNKLFTNSKLKSSRLQIGTASFFFGGGMIVLAALNHLPIRPIFVPPNEFFTITTSLFFGIVFLHFLMDHLMFRMRDESVNQNIAPLLLPLVANG